MSPCEYVENQCFGTNCEPCESKFPSCIGKPDGSNVFPPKKTPDITSSAIVKEQYQSYLAIKEFTVIVCAHA